MKRIQRSGFFRFNRRGELPEVVQDLKLRMDTKSDRYILSFTYRDSVISLPVVNDFSGGTQTVQVKEKAFAKKYVRAKKEAEKESSVSRKALEDWYKEIAQNARLAQANMLAGMDVWSMQRAEMQRVGLTSFGMVNCDYFSRNKPDYFVQLDSVGVDQDGNEIAVPGDLRCVYPKNNVYLTSGRTVAAYKNEDMYLFYQVGEFEIAVVQKVPKEKTKDMVQPTIYRIDITGKSPEEVKQLIENVAT